MEDISLAKIPDFLSGGGEMGERIRNFDWRKTSLGEPQHWEQSLKTCVHIMLTSSQPIWIGWGKELIKLYNDAYRTIAGGKHPQALGMPVSIVWKDIWTDIEPMLNKAMFNDEGTYAESQLLIMERYGYPEETYYTFSYTPVLGENGKPAGIICFNTADTERIINERSLQTLQELDTIAQKKTESEIYEQAVKAIETNSKDFPFAIFYKIHDDGDLATLISAAGLSLNHPELQHSINLKNPNSKGKNIALAVKENRIVESVNNGRWKDLPKGAWSIMPDHYVHIPIKAVNKKYPLSVLTLGINPYRKFDDAFRNFVQLIADRISLGINNILAYEQERNIAKTRAAAEERLKNFLMQAPAAIAIVEGAEFRYTFANPLYKKLFATTKEELIGGTIKEGFPELATQEIYNIVANVYKSAVPYVMHEFSVKTKEGENVKSGYYDFEIRPIKNNEGKVSDLMIIAFEVTGSVIVRKKIEESEERFRTLANEAPLFVWLTDKDLYTTFLNQTGLTYFKADSVNDLKWKDFIHPDDLDGVLNTMHNAATAHKSYTVEMRLKNGETNHYHWFLDKGVPRYNNEEFIGFIGTSLDINDRKQSEKILQESEARFRTLTEALPQLVLMTNANGVQQFASKSWIDFAGLIPHGEMWFNIIHPDDIASVGESWISNLQLGKTYKVELRLKNKEGEYRWHLGQGEPIRDKEGNIINWIGAFTDIHDRKTFADKLEAEVAQRTFELERSNKELESFNYIASHDLQEPLRKIQTFILLLEKSLADEETSKKYINKITASAQRMSQLIQSVLDYSRLSQASERFEETDLNRILENVKTDYELLIAEKGAVINSDKLPVINAIPLQMQQLLSNLISNSLKFNDKQPIINITSRIVTSKEISIPHEANKKKKFAEIKFTDNGIGFESQYSEQIFKLFQRLHNKSEYSGTGVGLSIVSKIVEGHNGFIKAESQDKDGATFTLWLPVE